MKKRPSESAVTAWARLVRAQNQVLEGCENALKAVKLPPLSWYDVLIELHRARNKGGLRQYEIAARTLLPKYNLSRLLDKLERENLIQRQACPEDGRGNIVRITTAGTRLLKRMWRVYGAEIHDRLECSLTATEITKLGAILGKLINSELKGSPISRLRSSGRITS